MSVYYDGQNLYSYLGIQINIHHQNNYVMRKYISSEIKSHVAIRVDWKCKLFSIEYLAFEYERYW
jgi:hypothetical protein